MTKPYIPPPNLHFRLLGDYSNTVVVAQTSSPYGVSTRPVGNANADEFFELIPVATLGSTNYYLIKAKASQKFLYSRFRPNPPIGFVDKGDIVQNWFSLEFGTGKYASHFRLVSYQSKTVISSLPYGLKNVHKSSDDDTQYFSFLLDPDDMNVESVSYDLGKAQPAPSTTITVAQKKEDNTSGREKTITFAHTGTLTHTLTFQHTDGFNIAKGTSFKTNLPFIADSGLKIHASKTETVKWGDSITQQDAYSFSSQIKVPANTCVNALATAKYTIMDVPYTMTLRSSKYPTYTTTSHGILKGVWKWALIVGSEKCP